MDLHMPKLPKVRIPSFKREKKPSTPKADAEAPKLEGEASGEHALRIKVKGEARILVSGSENGKTLTFIYLSQNSLFGVNIFPDLLPCASYDVHWPMSVAFVRGR